MLEDQEQKVKTFYYRYRNNGDCLSRPTFSDKLKITLSGVWRQCKLSSFYTDTTTLYKSAFMFVL